MATVVTKYSAEGIAESVLIRLRQSPRGLNTTSEDKYVEIIKDLSSKAFDKFNGVDFEVYIGDIEEYVLFQYRKGITSESDMLEILNEQSNKISQMLLEAKSTSSTDLDGDGIADSVTVAFSKELKRRF
jgi:hypothetical protein